MVVKERISGVAFEHLVLSTPDVQWELHHGAVREKPGMSAQHNWAMFYLGHLLQTQLDVAQYQVRVNAGHIRYTPKNYYLPDVCVVPIALVRVAREHPLEVYDAPLPLVVEVWSPSTSEYDIDSKLPEYQARGDLEIWRIQPYERTLTAWVRQDNGSYTRTDYQGGTVWPTTLPNVAIDLAVLFAN